MCRAVAFSQVASDLPLPTSTVQVTRCVTNAGSDFYTGVMAALITRSGNPAWVPASLKDVRLGWRIGHCTMRACRLLCRQARSLLHQHQSMGGSSLPTVCRLPPPPHDVLSLTPCATLLSFAHSICFTSTGAARTRGPVLPAAAAGAGAAAAARAVPL